MTRYFLSTIACLGLMMACGSNHASTKPVGPAPTDTAVAACQPTDCGAEPPISPSTCPTGESISTACERTAAGACERRILCDGQPAADATVGTP